MHPDFLVYHKGKRTKTLINLPADLEATGVFESLRCYQGKIFREQEHFKRLRESAKSAGLEGGINFQEIEKDLHDSLNNFFEKEEPKAKASDYVFIRISVFAQGTYILIGFREHPQNIYEKGVHVQTSPVPRVLSNASFPEAKTMAFQNSVLASLEPSQPGIYDWLFLDRDGRVMEVKTGNIFMVTLSAKKKYSLKTPPCHGILNGVTRRFVIEFAHEKGIETFEEPLARHDLYNADEVFLTNTSWEILPVAKLDGRSIGAKVPGDLTLKLQRYFKQQVRKELK